MALPNPLGPYLIERQLGAGGFAIVYLALDQRRGHRLALKVLRPEHAGGEPLRRFQREGEQMLSLRHQHIVSAFDAGHLQGYYYIAMPHLAGGSLADLLQRQGRLDLQTATRIVEQIATALDFVHPGLIHRDLKANNILLDAQGDACVADFGVAHVQNASAITNTGMQPGTTVCMAPEQIRSSLGPVGPATDVWALGVMLYQMLCGRLPFQHDDPLGVLFQVVNEAPPKATSINRDLSAQVDALFAHALEKNPRLRYQRAGDLARDLRKIAGPAPVDRPVVAASSSRPATPVGARPQPRKPATSRKPRSGWPFAAATAGLILVVLLFVVLHRTPRAVTLIPQLTEEAKATVVEPVAAGAGLALPATAEVAFSATHALDFTRRPAPGTLSAHVNDEVKAAIVDRGKGTPAAGGGLDGPATAERSADATSTVSTTVEGASQNPIAAATQAAAKTPTKAPTKKAAPLPAPVALAAPELAGPEDGHTAQFDTLELAWNPVQGATSYLVELRRERDAPGDWRNWATTNDTSYKLSFSDADFFRSGDVYFWRVTALNLTGRPGPAAKERGFKYDTNRAPAPTDTPVPPPTTPAPPPTTPAPPPTTPAPPMTAPPMSQPAKAGATPGRP